MPDKEKNLLRARQTACALAILIALGGVSHAQKTETHPSSRSTAACKFEDGGSVHIDYSSIPAKGRKIFGSLVPYGKIWRTGGSQATTLASDTDLSIGGENIPAGSYTLFTIPQTEKWTLIISKKADEAEGSYPEGKDLARVDMRVSKTPALVENLTIDYDRKADSCVLRITWENTEASVKIAKKKLCWPTTSPLTYQCPDP